MGSYLNNQPMNNYPVVGAPSRKVILPYSGPNGPQCEPTVSVPVSSIFNLVKGVLDYLNPNSSAYNNSCALPTVPPQCGPQQLYPTLGPDFQHQYPGWYYDVPSEEVLTPYSGKYYPQSVEQDKNSYVNSFKAKPEIKDLPPVKAKKTVDYGGLTVSERTMSKDEDPFDTDEDVFDNNSFGEDEDELAM